jgi:hypothetical protein
MWTWGDVDVERCGRGEMWTWEDVDVGRCGRGDMWTGFVYFRSGTIGWYF